MMDYIKSNKMAWEEAFEKRRAGWGDDHWKALTTQSLPFFNKDMAAEMKRADLEGKTIAHFCCNNGRELLSAMQLGAVYGVGFDIAENFIDQARQIAAKVGRDNCDFVACNLLEIDEAYRDRFDLVFFTAGALAWFQDLNLLFAKVSECLKPSGVLLINEIHPFTSMLPMPDEEPYDPENPDRVTYPYFRDYPWMENSGMHYITPKYKSKTFTSFAHTLAGIINAIAGAGICIKQLSEYDYDIGLSDVYDGKKMPLSYILAGEKR